MIIYMDSKPCNDPILEAFDIFYNILDRVGRLSESTDSDSDIDLKKELKNAKLALKQNKKLEKYYKIAEDANSYVDDIVKLSNDKHKKGKRLYLVECYHASSATYTYRAQFIFKLFDFKALATHDKETLNDMYKNFIEPYKRANYFKRRPEMRVKKIYGTVQNVASNNSKLIDTYKSAIADYKRIVDSMIKNVDVGIEMLNNADEDTVRMMKKFVVLQKKIYKHDSYLLAAFAQLIIKQSKILKKYIDKNSDL